MPATGPGAARQMVTTTGALAFVSRVSIEGTTEVREIPMRGLSVARTLALATRQAVPLWAAAGAFARDPRQVVRA